MYVTSGTGITTLSLLKQTFLGAMRVTSFRVGLFEPTHNYWN